jgi:hypothetical protein
MMRVRFTDLFLNHPNGQIRLGHLATQYGYEHMPAVHMFHEPCPYRKFQRTGHPVIFPTSNGEGKLGLGNHSA